MLAHKKEITFLIVLVAKEWAVERRQHNHVYIKFEVADECTGYYFITYLFDVVKQKRRGKCNYLSDAH